MSDYKSNHFKKPFGKSASRPYSDAPKQLFTAECSNCHATCEVPFRPNGSKPVFCRNCFNRDRSADDQNGRPSFEKRDFAPPRFERPGPNKFAPRNTPSAPDNRQVEALARQITNLEGKIDRLFALMENPAPMEPAAAKKIAPKKKKVSKK